MESFIWGWMPISKFFIFLSLNTELCQLSQWCPWDSVLWHHRVLRWLSTQTCWMTCLWFTHSLKILIMFRLYSSSIEYSCRNSGISFICYSWLDSKIWSYLEKKSTYWCAYNLTHLPQLDGLDSDLSSQENIYITCSAQNLIWCLQILMNSAGFDGEIHPMNYFFL